MAATRNETTAPHPELLATLAQRFPHESSDQLRDRALRVIDLGEKLQREIADFWAQTPRKQP
jgi:hypothetical protein